MHSEEIAMQKQSKSRPSMTMDDLIDDCLVPVLARLPFHDQFTSVPLTCKRWYALLAGVHLKRTSLVVCGNSSLISNYYVKSFHRFHQTSPVSTERYVKYTANWLSATKSEEASSQPDYHYRKSLDIGACIQIGEYFPNLKHLSLVYVDLSLETLLGLLGHFPTQLESLILCVPQIEPYFDQFKMQPEKGVLIGRILTLIDGMPLLRQLGLRVCAPFLTNLSLSLSSLLPRLQELTLSNGHLDVYPILLRLDDGKLRRLTLEYTGWPNLHMFSHLLAEKPGLRGLTHLSLSDYLDLSKGGYPTTTTSLSLVEQLCDHFPLLEYLYLPVKDTLRCLLPYLCKLKNLLHLQICSYSACELLDGTFIDGHPSIELLSQCEGIPSLQVLIIQRLGMRGAPSRALADYQMAILSENPQSLPLISSHLFPQLRQLYLDCYFWCRCLKEGTGFSLPSHRPVGCTCKARIIQCLHSFEHIPKIEVPNSVPKCSAQLN